MTARLSKSKLMAYRQCPRRLYLEVTRPELVEVSDASAAARMAGTGVGEVARSFYPDGCLIGSSGDLAAALRQTAQRLKAPDRPVLFEATVCHDRVLVRADLLIADLGL